MHLKCRYQFVSLHVFRLWSLEEVELLLAVEKVSNDNICMNCKVHGFFVLLLLLTCIQCIL